MTMNNPIPIKELIGDAKTIGIAGHIRAGWAIASVHA